MAGDDVEIELIRATARAAVETTAVGRSRKDFLTVAGGQADGTAAADTLASLIARGPDWDRVQHLAEFHGTIPLLEQGLSQLPEGIVPASVQQTLRDRCRDIAAKNLLLSGRLTQASQALQQAGIRVLAIKGPTLAVLGYSDLSLRQFNDIDLLVPPTEFDRGLEVLHDLGYESALRVTPAQQVRYARSMGQVVLHDAQGTLLELHTRLTDRAYHFPLDFDALWSQRQPVVLHDRPLSTLGDEDLLLYAAVHGSKHGWPCLGWVVDLVQLVTRKTNTDWPRLLQRATTLRCRRILLLSLWLARESLGMELPAAVSRACEVDRVGQRLGSERSRRLWEVDDDHPESAFGFFGFHLRSRERLRDGVSFLWATIFSPHLSDWQAVNLPARWEFLYPIARPLRLALKYGALLRRRLGLVSAHDRR